MAVCRKSRPSGRKTLATMLGVVTALLYAMPVNAFSLGAGVAAVEEGDDRLRPAALVHAGWTENYMSNLIFYGRSFQDVTQQTMIFSSSKRGSVPGFKSLKASAGLFMIDEQTRIKAVDPDTGKMMATENSWTGGVVFGLEGHLLQIGRLKLRAAWESYLVPAGVNGLIFLATGRKQLFSLVMGGGL